MTEKILLNDVVLRESAQVEGGAMSPTDQLRYVQYLIDGGIDTIEIGYPGSSEAQLAQCLRIVEFVSNYKTENKPLLSGLAPARESEIRVVKESGCDVCHIYIPSSDNLMLVQFDAYKYGSTPEGKRRWVIHQAVKMVKFAKSLGFEKVEYSPEDAASTSPGYLCEIIEAVINAGADIVNIPDTTGMRVLSEFGDLIKYIFETVPNIADAIVSVHCHNDSGNADSNALQAIANGASQVEGTFYGLGERSGMTKLEVIIMVVNARRDIFDSVEIAFDSTLCVKIVNFVSNALGMSVPRHWPVVGLQNGICSSGTHQAIEVRAKQQGKDSSYYSWNPNKYGHGKVEIVVGQSSGRQGVESKLSALGYNVTSEQLVTISKKIKKVSEAKPGVALADRELAVIVQDVIADIPFPIAVNQCQAIGGEGTIPTASVVLSAEGKIAEDSKKGDGPFDAVMKAVQSAASEIFPALKGVQIILDDWRPIPVTKGGEALADVYARIKVVNGNDAIFTGRAVHLDTIQASAQAFANCLSWYLASVEVEKKENEGE